MSTPITTAKPSAAAKSDIDQIKDDIKAIREDFASLATTTGKIAAGQVKKQTRRAGELADTAAEKAATYRDLVSDKVKDHTFAALGAAALAGLVLSSMRRR